MNIDPTILRLVISQIFAVIYILFLIPLKEPKKRQLKIYLVFILLIVLLNAMIIFYVSLNFYIRIFFITLLLPHFLIMSYLAIYKRAKLLFGLLSVQVIGNVAILNGLMTSFIFYGENNPLADLIARVVTYLIFLPIVFKFIRPIYLKMLDMLTKGWSVLNLSLIISYMLAYFILFVPNDIFKRPEYFAHAYIVIILSLLSYAVIYFLFIEVQSKKAIEADKKLLSTKVHSLSEESAKIRTIVYKDYLTGINNRYSLYRQMDLYIENKQHFQVVFVDLDNLKFINDTYNHKKGDAYLKSFAIALQNTIKNQGEVYRFAGDEFVCLLTHDYLNFNREKFKNDIAETINIDVPYFGMSLGVANYPSDALNSDDLINIADQAMYTEKKYEKNLRR